MPKETTQFKKGKTGNKGGRPKQSSELRAKCRTMTDELIERLRKIATEGDSDAASVAATKLLLAYGYGAPEGRPIDDADEDVQTSAGMNPKTAAQVLSLVKGKGVAEESDS